MNVAFYLEIGGIIMLSTTNTEQLFGLACSGNIKALEDYWNGEGDLHVTYQKFGKEHSLIMGALRNNQFETVEYLINVGETITDEEKEQILTELKRIDIMKKLVN